MRDITAILIDYSDQAALSRALNSLRPIRSRISSVMVLYRHERPSDGLTDAVDSDHLQLISAQGEDMGKWLQETINTLATPFVLWLSGRDYLPAATTPDTFQLDDNQTVLGTFKQRRNTTIQTPVFVRTSRVSEKPLNLSSELPFQEALLPSWLIRVPDSEKIFKEGLVKEAGISHERDTVETYQFMQKYQLEPAHIERPSLTVIMPAYNMAAYVQTAVASTLLQHDQPDQLLIMDDGSTDATHERLQRYSQDRRVQLFQQENSGKARALNRLLAHVTSDFILELDADDWLDPDAISVIKTHLARLPADRAVLYGNLRLWKQLSGTVQFKQLARGMPVSGRNDLLAYRFPLGPRVYRTSLLKRKGGFPVSDFADGRLYEDVSTLNRLIKHHRFQYEDFTVYNVRKHSESITKQNDAHWRDFLKSLD
ncbi:hypothetical protein GCM10028778_26270 [Barrientosiimonas marina]|uniref:Glycosyltransferase family 2 protein n=1 Tax=Lentibacillus kimchii TaxID=1542911 RepID=A0ABW2UWX2_9BACI